MFEWSDEKYGVRPTEGACGSFNNRETSVTTCGCGAPKSVYTDDGTVCEEQSAALHAEFHGYESAEAFMEATEAAASSAAEALFNAIIAPALLESMLADALGLPPGVGISLIPVSPEEAAAMGFPGYSESPMPVDADPDSDWFNMMNVDEPPVQ